MSNPPDDDFLSRRTRRKRAIADAQETPRPEKSELPEEDTPPPGETEEQLLARLDLPDPDTLEEGDDFSRFMSGAVPEHLRRRALRKLWRSNPTLAVLDGLNDYDDDFTGGFVAPGTLKTAYEVGRGIVSKLDGAAQAVAEDREEATNPPDRITQDTDTVPEPEAAARTDDPGRAEEQLEDRTIAERATRRRMQFRTTPDD